MATPPDTGSLAGELRVVVGQLLRRLRAEHRFSLSQGAVLGRLDRQGTMSIGELALAERVRPQSMAQTIAEMESERLLARRPDPSDGRRMLIDLTPHGRTVLEEDRRQREGWLALAIEEDLSPAERRILARALPLLRRLGESDSPH
jgi:DNA-binding MarR family transcriptional regulator